MATIKQIDCKMKHIIYSIVFLSMVVLSCSPSEIDTNINDPDPSASEFKWIVPVGDINGSLNPFPLALNPNLKKVEDVKFLADDALVAIISFGDEIRVYPYQYMNAFESVNDEMNDISFAMTYCPITKSGLCWDRNFRNENFIIRASGYLYIDNLIAYDEKTDTYWSQMLAKCIKGKYHGENNKTHNFIETTWKTVRENLGNANVFTNVSTSNKSGVNKVEIPDNEGVYGILNLDYSSGAEKGRAVYFYQYDLFENETKVFTNRISNRNVIVVGNKDLHFITTFIVEGNETYKAVQNQFPIVLEDSENNRWNIFGVAVEGPRKGQQLQSLTGFVASWWAWQLFYDDFDLTAL